MEVHLVDGTYELFRYFFALPPHRNGRDEEVSATRGVVGSLLGLLEGGATHVGVATDHVIESFRNDLWGTYKTGAGVDPELLSQFPLLERALTAAGFVVWPMVEFEADDALASAAAISGADERVARVLICTPDKDLAQCVTDDGRIVQFDRRKDAVLDRAAVVEKFGVAPASIPDYLALVGDTADGFPGLKGWGAKSAARVLGAFGHLEDIPADVADWGLDVRGAAKLRRTLDEHYDEALLFRRIATLEVDAPTIESVDELEWRGPTPDLPAICDHLDAPGLGERAVRLAERRQG